MKNRQWRLIPAYGRDYENHAELRKDFELGKDFVIADFSDPYDGKPVNLTQMTPGDAVFVRYSRLQKVCSFIVSAPGAWRLEDALTRTQKAALVAVSAGGVTLPPRTVRSLQRLGLVDRDGDLTIEGRLVQKAVLVAQHVTLDGETVHS
jgi:hypothetical protein